MLRLLTLGKECVSSVSSAIATPPVSCVFVFVAIIWTSFVSTLGWTATAHTMSDCSGSEAACCVCVCVCMCVLVCVRVCVIRLFKWFSRGVWGPPRYLKCRNSFVTVAGDCQMMLKLMEDQVHSNCDGDSTSECAWRCMQRLFYTVLCLISLSW